MGWDQLNFEAKTPSGELLYTSVRTTRVFNVVD